MVSKKPGNQQRSPDPPNDPKDPTCCLWEKNRFGYRLDPDFPLFFNSSITMFMTFCLVDLGR